MVAMFVCKDVKILVFSEKLIFVDKARNLGYNVYRKEGVRSISASHFIYGVAIFMCYKYLTSVGVVCYN